jgi:hypothetical protein
MMVFGKQSTTDAVEKPNSMAARAFHLSLNERRLDDSTPNQDNSSTVISKLFPIQPDNMSLTLSSRYDLSSLNRSQTMVRLFKMICFIGLFVLFLLENI